MNTITKQCIEIELKYLKLPFKHLRIDQSKRLNHLTTFIERQGQLTPVIVIEGAPTSWVLIDGYLRIQALKRLGEDTVIAEVWSCKPEEALLALLAGQQSRAFEAIEEGLLIQELQERYELKLQHIARRIGHEQSWVSRRLSLVKCLPDKICECVINGTISIWSATRILGPMARANKEQALSLVNYLLENHHSTRELQGFFQHYQSSNRKTRQQMINTPALFFKSYQQTMAKQKYPVKPSPEEQWQFALNSCCTELKKATQLLSLVFYENQDAKEQEQLLKAFASCKHIIHLLDNQLRSRAYVRQTNTSNDSLPAAVG